MTKLVYGKVTYVHRALWPRVIAVGRAREPWQMKGLAAGARKLLGAVEPRARRAEPAPEQGQAFSEVGRRISQALVDIGLGIRSQP